MSKLAVVSLLLLPVLASCEGVGAVYVVRHADRDGSQDALLNPEGVMRAQALADELSNNNVAAIFSTNTVRTTSTAQPLADDLGLTVQLYGSPAQVVETVQTSFTEQVVLIVGHSNTVPEIITEFGADLPTDLPLDASGHLHELDFDNLELVLFNAGGGASAFHSTYGAPTAP